MRNHFLLIIPAFFLFAQCQQENSQWPGPNPQVREVVSSGRNVSAKTSFYYDNYNNLSEILFFGAGKVYDCEVEFNGINDVIRIPGDLDENGIIEMEWNNGKPTKYFRGEQVADFIYGDGALQKVEIRINGAVDHYCNISFQGENIKTIEKYDGDDNLISKTEYMAYDDQPNLFKKQWWYWWITWNKGYHWNDSFPIMLFMTNNPVSVKTVEGGTTYNDEISYTFNEYELIDKMSITGDHNPAEYAIIY